MATRIAAALITFLLTLGAAVVVLFFMLVAMNGFSERDATWGLAAYGLLVLVLGLVAGTGAAMLAGSFTRREMHPALAALLAVLISSVAGILFVGASGFVGVIVAEIARTRR